MDVSGYIDRLNAEAQRGSISDATVKTYTAYTKAYTKLFAEWATDTNTNTNTNTPNIDIEPDAEMLRDYVEYLAYERQLTNQTIRVRVSPLIRYARYAGIFDSEFQREWGRLRSDFKPSAQDTPSFLKPETVDALKQAAKPDSSDIINSMNGVSREMLSDDELEYLDDAAPGDEREYAIVCLLAATGIRVGELCGLTVGDISLTEPDSAPNAEIAGTVDIQRQKRKENVVDTIPLRSEAVTAVEQYVSIRESYFENRGPKSLQNDDAGAYPPSESDALFVTSSWSADAMERYGDGWGITPYYVRDILKTVGNRADTDSEEMNTDGIYPHLFRHTAASRLAQAGYTNVQIASWLGVEPSTADIYADISPEEMTEMATALDNG